MSNVQRDILTAKNLIYTGNDFEIRNRFKSIYPFTNENLIGCLNNFDLKDKECLTVLGSSDQVFDMYLKGAKRVDTFDINPLTKYYFYLKKAALLTDLTREEYLKFFCYNKYEKRSKPNLDAFNEKTFSRISKNLNGNSYYFWSNLFENYSPLEIRRPFSLFSFDEIGCELLKKSVNYLDKNNYERLKDMAHSLTINFKECDIRKLASKMEKSYDFIYLSNIIQYAESLYEGFPTHSKKVKLYYYRLLIQELIPYLNIGGQIVGGYIYDARVSCRGEAVFNTKILDEIFKEEIFVRYYFQSISDILYQHISGSKDMCLVYKK